MLRGALTSASVDLENIFGVCEDLAAAAVNKSGLVGHQICTLSPVLSGLPDWLESLASLPATWGPWLLSTSALVAALAELCSRLAIGTPVPRFIRSTALWRTVDESLLALAPAVSACALAPRLQGLVGWTVGATTCDSCRQEGGPWAYALLAVTSGALVWLCHFILTLLLAATDQYSSRPRMPMTLFCAIRLMLLLPGAVLDSLSLLVDGGVAPIRSETSTAWIVPLCLAMDVVVNVFQVGCDSSLSAATAAAISSSVVPGVLLLSGVIAATAAAATLGLNGVLCSPALALPTASLLFSLAMRLYHR